MQNINCPSCGSQMKFDQQFCRTCGTSLRADEPGSINRRMLWGLLMAFGGIVIALAGKMLLQLNLVTFIGVLISLSGMFFIAAYPFLTASLRQKFAPGRNTHPESLPHADTTNKLPPINETDFVPSVTENTTNLLKVPVRSDSHN